tara:strand:+ start:53213 stop:53605 length:393 start_codon:yes stop_codon:yes gene_type:complete
MENNRITLQYSVEESQLKFEVHRLVTNALNRLNSISCEEPPPASVLSMSTADEIESLRTELAKIDILFGDASAIIQNYIDYKHRRRMSDATTPDIPTNGAIPNLDSLNLDALNEKIQNFKDNLNSHENAD